MSHTPGPWRVEDRPGRGYGKEFLVYTPRGFAFAGDQLKPDGVSLAEARANAALAAAAPDLLEALKRARDKLILEHGHRPGLSAILVESIDPAIAKAEGR
jgi:hypothetical protein